jgi:hypothetical protein
MKTRASNTDKEKKKTNDLKRAIVDTFKDASREEKRREAGKPMYLVRYE